MVAPSQKRTNLWSCCSCSSFLSGFCWISIFVNVLLKLLLHSLLKFRCKLISVASRVSLLTYWGSSSNVTVSWKCIRCSRLIQCSDRTELLRWESRRSLRCPFVRSSVGQAPNHYRWPYIRTISCTFPKLLQSGCRKRAWDAVSHQHSAGAVEQNLNVL